MNKSGLIQKLAEALTLEETTVFAELNKARAVVESSVKDQSKRSLMLEKIDFLATESARHSGLVSGLIKKVNESNEAKILI